MVTNFLSNAYKHTNSGQVTLLLEMKDQGTKISVEDTGCGIALEKQKLLFGRFAKLNDFAQGSGLGLFISKTLVEQCNGVIGCKSTKGVGSTFWAYLPNGNF